MNVVAFKGKKKTAAGAKERQLAWLSIFSDHFLHLANGNSIECSIECPMLISFLLKFHSLCK